MTDEYYKGKMYNNIVFFGDWIFSIFICPQDRGFQDHWHRKKGKGFTVKRNK